MRWLALFLLISPGLAQSLQLGGYASIPYSTPTLQASLPLTSGTLALRAQLGAWGLTYTNLFPLGPLGLLEGSLEGTLSPNGFELGASGEGALGSLALQGKVSYASLPRNELWVEAPNLTGWTAFLTGKGRIPEGILTLGVQYVQPYGGGSVSLSRGNWTFGGGALGGPYLALGWRKTLDLGERLVALRLQVGDFSQEGAPPTPGGLIEGSYDGQSLKADLMVAYPWAGSLTIVMPSSSLRLGYTPSQGWWIWLQESIALGGSS
jgi:hypothetical protein